MFLLLPSTTLRCHHPDVVSLLVLSYRQSPADERSAAFRECFHGDGCVPGSKGCFRTGTSLDNDCMCVVVDVCFDDACLLEPIQGLSSRGPIDGDARRQTEMAEIGKSLCRGVWI